MNQGEGKAETGAPPRPAPSGREIPDAEKAALRMRRQALGDTEAPMTMGLALSGGGIRSATFCLGLLRGLAKNRVLHRFDYLSTVSGGGYIGAAFGRLFNAQAGAAEVERGLADDGSLLLWWLRSNGRYLIPSGAADVFQVWAGHLRGFIATQIEVAALLLLLACLIVLPHLGFAAMDQHPALQATLLGFYSPWFAMALLLVMLLPVLLYAFWFSRDQRPWLWLIDAGLCVAAGLIGAYALQRAVIYQPAVDAPLIDGVRLALLLVVATSLTLPAGFLLRQLRACARVTAAADRVVYTAWLADLLKLALLCAVLGAVDLGSWLLAGCIKDGVPHVAGGAGLTALLIAAARLALPWLQQRADKLNLASLPLASLGNALGLLLLLMIAAFWLSQLQLLVFMESAEVARRVLGAALATEDMRYLVVASVVLGYVALTGWNLEQINRSSLHLFYRSRLTRAYLSVGNHDAATATRRFPASPLLANTRELTVGTREITELLDGDDVRLRDYAPHRYGGPLHLINCCINQTIDDRTGSYNADRKGVSCAVSPLGIETGARCEQQPHDGDTWLSQWVSISGAAISSGMGSRTRPGVAALSFLSGFRLGFWWQRSDGRRVWLWTLLGKYCATLAEMLARFPGLRNPVWYLSDGGHFDNTGVYALLKRRLPLIVLADCGADPSYTFGDLENLVRKARIDYDADIEFVNPSSLPASGPASDKRVCFGTPDSMSPEAASQHLLLARVRYSQGGEGALLIVKPRRDPGLPLDLAGYGDRDPGFPQQSTGDQFFDEAQWESYCELGLRAGRGIDAELLEALPGWLREARTLGSARVAQVPSSEQTQEQSTRRQRIATTVGTSLGIGAFASLLLTGWQAWDTHRQSELQMQKNFIEDARQLAGLIEKADSFTPDLKLKLMLLSRSVQNRGEDPVQQTLLTLAPQLKPLCEASSGALSEDCRSYFNWMLGEKPQTVWRARLTSYRSWRPSIVAVTTAPVPTPVPVMAMPGESAAPVQAPAPALDLAAAARAACRLSPPKRYVIYSQIYSESQRGDLQKTLLRMADLGVAPAKIENVAATAAAAHRPEPIAWPRATFIYQPDSQDCAQALSNWLAQQPDYAKLQPQARPLPDSLRGTSGIIKLWLPPPVPAH